MPQTVAELIEAARIVGARAADRSRRGSRCRRSPARSRRLVAGPGAARRFDLAEMAREGELPLVVEILVAEDQHRIAVDRCARSRRSRSASSGTPGIDPGHLARRTADAAGGLEDRIASRRPRRRVRQTRRSQSSSGASIKCGDIGLRSSFKAGSPLQASSGPCRARGRPRSAGCGGARPGGPAAGRSRPPCRPR